MLKYISVLSLWALLTLPASAVTSRVWALNYEDGSISVIDTATNKVVQTIQGIPRPHGAVFSPDGSRAYIASETSEHLLYVVDTKTGEIIKKVQLSGRPNLPAIAPDGGKVYVCIREPGPPMTSAEARAHNYHEEDSDRVAKTLGAIDVIDTNTLIARTIPVRAPLHDCYTTPDGNYMAVGSPEGKFVEVFNLHTEKVAWEVPEEYPIETMTFEVGPDNSTRFIFVTIEGYRGFQVVDFITHKQFEIIKFPDPPEGVQAKDPHFISTHVHGMVVSPDGRTLYIGVIGSSQIFAYSLPDLKLKSSIVVPTLPEPGLIGVDWGVPAWLALTPDGKSLYVALQNSNSVDVIDTKTMKEVDRIKCGRNTARLAMQVIP